MMTLQEKQQYIRDQRAKGVDDNTILNDLKSKNALTQQELSVGQNQDNAHGLVPGSAEHQIYTGLNSGTLDHNNLIEDQPVTAGGVEYTPGGFLKNTLSSGANLVGGVVHAVTHPLQTAKNIGKLAVGGVQALTDTGQGTETRSMAEQVGQFYKQRYGGLRNIADTFYTDPLGALGDLSTILGIGAGAIGAASKVGTLGEVAKVGEIGSMAEATNLSKVAGKLSRAADLTDPFSITGKVYKSLVDNGFTESMLTPKQHNIVEGADTFAKAIAKGDNAQYEELLNPHLKMSDEELKAAGLTPEKVAKEQGQTLQELGQYKTATMKSQTDFNATSPFGMVRSKADQALEILKNKISGVHGPNIGKTLEGAAGDEVVNLDSMLTDISKKVSDKTGYDFLTAGGKPAPILMEGTKTGAKISEKEAEQIQNVINEVSSLPKNATRRQVDAKLQKIDSMVKYSDSPASSVVGDIRKYLSTKATEGELGTKYGQANQAFSSAKTLESELSKVLNSEGTAPVMGVFSPAKGDAYKELFARVKNETGIDLTKQAVLAKLAVDAFGNPEQLNLLKEATEAAAVGIVSPLGGKLGMMNRVMKVADKIINTAGKESAFKNAEDVIRGFEKDGTKLTAKEKGVLKNAFEHRADLPDVIKAWKDGGVAKAKKAVDNIKNPIAKKAMQGLFFLEKAPVARSRVNTALNE